ncbi:MULTISPECIES: hypothetical protein [Clostridium]|uniref:Cyclic lactone autoinducer peptide n=1 Tax=Clostridium senegalense TaxID=1465809 RepID=A0A6M0H4L2_9CLOT|nr:MULTISPECIES: hypothetical protein [Clostridium]NEU05218.1 hypothetical protein [Clostridium senegalense]
MNKRIKFISRAIVCAFLFSFCINGASANIVHAKNAKPLSIDPKEETKL